MFSARDYEQTVINDYWIFISFWYEEKRTVDKFHELERQNSERSRLHHRLQNIMFSEYWKLNYPNRKLPR